MMIPARVTRSSTLLTAAGILAPLALAVACSGTDAGDLNNQYGNAGGSAGAATTGQSGSTATSGQPAGGSTGTAGSDTSTAGTPPASGGSESAAGSGTGGMPPVGGTGTAGGTGGVETGGTGGGTGGSSGGSGGMAVGGGGSGAGGMAPAGPYAPRTGSFKMLVYSQNVTGGYKHPSIPDGQAMLKNIGMTQGFEVTVATNEAEITKEGLAKYEIVFFMNSTGEIFSADQRKTYEEWIKNNGAYGGVHAAADTANGWTFYKEMTGQYYDLHDACCASADIRWTTEGESHVTVKGLPSPWTRSEEWYKFNKYSDWSTKTGFKILGTVTTAGGGTRPVSFVREWGNFRSFYTSLGHESSTFKDAQVIKHITAGIMWAVRREALIK